MRLHGDVFGCEHCGIEFERRRRRGRHPHYCSRTCRQRAFEARRRGAYVMGLPAAPVARPKPSRANRPAYETGVNLQVRHALRPDGMPDHRHARPTLCGTRAYTSPVRFAPWLCEPKGFRSCRTCWRIAQQYPPTSLTNAPSDLALVRNLLSRLRAAVAGWCPPEELRAGLATVLAQIDAAIPLPNPGLPPEDVVYETTPTGEVTAQPVARAWWPTSGDPRLEPTSMTFVDSADVARGPSPGPTSGPAPDCGPDASTSGLDGRHAVGRGPGATAGSRHGGQVGPSSTGRIPSAPIANRSPVVGADDGGARDVPARTDGSPSGVAPPPTIPPLYIGGRPQQARGIGRARPAPPIGSLAWYLDDLDDRDEQRTDRAGARDGP